LTYRRVIIPVIADMHSGLEYALMNPETILKKEGKEGLTPDSPEMTESQAWLWECYEKDLSDLKYLMGDDLGIAILNGDLHQGNKHPAMLVSDRISDQIIIAKYNLQPLMRIPNIKAVRFGMGTEAHNFGKGAAEILLAEMLQEGYPQMDIGNMYHGLLDIDGYLVDYAHHGPYPGSREWLKGNVAILYLKDIMIRAICRGEKPPNAVLRAHFHQWLNVLTSIGEHESRLIISPSYCMLGDYAHQAARSPDTIGIGMFALEIVDGKLIEVHKFMRSLDIRTKERL